MENAFKKSGYQFPDKRNDNRNQPSSNRRTDNYQQSRSRDQRNELRKSIESLHLPENYIDLAEEYIANNHFRITTSKIRKILTQIIEIFNEERVRTSTELTEKNAKKLQLVRMRMLYEAGRDGDVKYFLQKTQLIEYLKGVGNNRQAFLDYAHYMEALVAYHRYYGGKD